MSNLLPFKSPDVCGHMWRDRVCSMPPHTGDGHFYPSPARIARERRSVYSLMWDAIGACILVIVIGGIAGIYALYISGALTAK